MTTRFKLATLVATLAMAALLLAPMPAAAAANAATVPIAGSNNTGSFVGTATITNFVVRNGQLTAVGTLAGTLTNAGTGAVNTVLTNFSAPVTGIDPTCQILNLTIGPIHLDLLGLMIDTNTITLNITAQSGPGNLLGNLLCSITNALNNPGSLSQLLNQLLAALGL
jgi:hypothetical protein